MESMWPMADSIWKIVLIVVIVGGVTASHFGGILLERLLPHFGTGAEGGPRHPDRREIEALRRELEVSHQEADRLRTVEHRVHRIQEQVDFLERLLESEPSRER